MVKPKHLSSLKITMENILLISANTMNIMLSTETFDAIIAGILRRGDKNVSRELVIF
jgi:hypothetical protein